MNIVVVGTGEVGSHIARVLIQQGHNLTLVEGDAEAASRASERFDANVVLGHGAARAILQQAGAQHADLFVAVTSQCEVNLVAAITARELGARRTIARVTNPMFFEQRRGIVPNMLGIDIVINPLYQIAAEIRRLVRSRSALEIRNFADHQVEMMYLPIEPESVLVGRTLRDARLPAQTLVACVQRGKDLLVPSGADVLMPGDRVLVVGRTEAALDIERAVLGRRTRYGRRAMIVGGGLVAEQVALSLEEDEFSVTLIESDRDRCRALATTLERTVVLHGEGTNSALLEDEGIATCDVFLALDEEDEVNLMASLLAKSLGARRCMALVNRPDYGPVCERLGIDATLSPRTTVAQLALNHVGNAHQVSRSEVFEGRGAFLEYRVGADARIHDRRIMDAGFPRGTLVCAVTDAHGATVPDGQHILRVGDGVVVFALQESVSRLDRLFRPPSFPFGS